MAAPGKSEAHHLPWTIRLAPSLIIAPHSGLGGSIPSPMKLSPAMIWMA